MDIDDIFRVVEIWDFDDYFYIIGEELFLQFKVWFMNMVIFVEVVFKVNGVFFRQSCIDNIFQQVKFFRSFQGFVGFFN